MSGRTKDDVTIILPLDAAVCLNNALRREVATVERQKNDRNMLGVDEYLRRLDACVQAVTTACGKVIHR